MQKYKICPSCKTKNGPTLFECINCEADLTRVKITDEETEKMVQANTAAQQAEQSAHSLVRICDCGAKNPANARKCSACGEDISDITPSPDVQGTKKAPEFILSSLDGQYAYKLTSTVVTIGRDNTMCDYLAAKSYVSRIHAKLLIENDALYIENLSGTNFTYVNNKKTAGKTLLADGDEIGLGGTNINGKCQSEAAYFLVRINPCT